MVFEDIVAVLERAFKLELSVVQDTTVFEVASEDGSTKVQVLLQSVSERKLVLLSADLGEPPPEGCEKLFRTMLEANNLFSGTAGRVEPLDSRFPSVERSRGFSWRFWRNSSVTFPGLACIQVAGKVQKKKRRT